ncbi:MAG: hypothetical protein ACE5JQ_05430 [Candidatus Methylomirabilales bacterium]
MEDILTSNVFGVLKYLPPGSAMVPFLSKVKSPEGEQPLVDLPTDVKAEYEFWPWLEELDCNGCEPDVLIRITCPDGKKILALIEAKYHSSKSSDEGEEERLSDQLAREWDNLKRLAVRESAEPVLIYLTPDVGCPVADIRASQEELVNKRGEQARICWLSWRHLASLIADSSHEMLRDLVTVLRRLNLTLFEGFSRIEPHAGIQWTFSGKPVRFEWKCLQIDEPLKMEFRR